MFDTSSLDTHSICMSINPKRFNYLCENFKAVGLNPPKLFQGVRWNRGSNTGCVLAHITILNMCKLLHIPYVVIYEDDAYPRPDIKQKWAEILNMMPDNCGLLKLGNSSYRGDYVSVNSCMYRMNSGTAFGSHAYIVRNELYNTLIQKMVDLNVPDVAMNLEYYTGYYKPYVLNMEYHLFIQKNINIDNIIAQKGGQRYWYPNPVDKTGMTSGKPCKYFVDQLIDDEYKYIENISVVYNTEWKKGRKTAIVKDNLIYTKDEDGTLERINDNKWKINWSTGSINTLLYLNEKDNIKFYKIEEAT